VVDLEEAAQAVRDTSEDAFLTAKVKTALALSKSASAFDIKVESDNGVVTLSGALPSSDDKAAILEVARGTDGVLSIVDRIQVDPSAATLTGDDELAERIADLKVESAVYERLLASEALDARRVRISVQGGVVRLMGSVPDSSQKERVREVVQSVPGVASVVNELEVQAPAAARQSSP
jgi:hyperosmotically inducible periplasmic protein